MMEENIERIEDDVIAPITYRMSNSIPEVSKRLMTRRSYSHNVQNVKFLQNLFPRDDDNDI